MALSTTPTNKGAKKEKKAQVESGIFAIIVEEEAAIGGKASGCMAAINTPNRIAGIGRRSIKTVGQYRLCG